MIDEHEWKYILQIARDGTISQAAKHLYVSQPSLSQCVKKVESELGAQIFDRSTAPLQLTEAGEMYVDMARSIRDAKERLMNQISNLNELKSGKLIIGSSYTRSNCMLASIIPEFCQRFPGVKLQTVEGSTSRLKEHVLAGDVDFALLYEPLDKKSFNTIPITYERVLLAVPMSHPMLESYGHKQAVPYPKISFAKFDGVPFILLKETRKMRELYDKLCREEDVAPKPVYEANSILAAAQLCAKGLGGTFVTDNVVNCIPGPVQPFFFIPEEKIDDRHLVAAYARNKQLSRAAEVFIKLLKKE